MFALILAALTATPTPASPASAAPKAVVTPAPPKEPKPARVGITGVWEVQIQRDSGTTYTHLNLKQTGNTLTGTYLDTNNTRYPATGTMNGENVNVTVTLPKGEQLKFTGTESEGTDMLGMVETPKGVVGFTASYRPKYDWTDSITPNPGIGTGTGLPGAPPP